MQHANYVKASRTRGDKYLEKAQNAYARAQKLASSLTYTPLQTYCRTTSRRLRIASARLEQQHGNLLLTTVSGLHFALYTPLQTFCRATSRALRIASVRLEKALSLAANQRIKVSLCALLSGRRLRGHGIGRKREDMERTQ